MRHALPLVALIALAAPAGAQSVDQDGAKRLADTLSRYIGAAAFERGIVKVSPDGDAFRIDLDLDALAGLAPPERAFRFDVDPYSLRAKPLPDGSWEVGGDIMPGGWLEIDGPQGRQRAEWSIAGGGWTGVFDPALGAFTSGRGSIDSITMKSTDAIQQADIRIGRSDFLMVATRSAGGGIDFSSTQTMADFVETVKITEGGQPLSITIRAPELAFGATASGFRSREILDLVAFAVAHADEAKIKTAQGELKALLKATLPLWNKIKGSYDLRDIAVETPFGAFGIGRFGVDVSSDGIATNGALRYAFEISGLKLPPLPQMPQWGVPLLPADLSLNVAVAELDLDRPVRTFIDALDVTRDPPVPEEVTDRIRRDFEADPPRLVFEPSVVRNKDTEVTVQGDMTFEGGKPAAKVTIDVAGYDKAVEVLQNAATTDPQAQQAFPVALAVKGFAKTQPDGRLRWAIEARTDGSVFVNGGLIKPADPQ